MQQLDSRHQATITRAPLFPKSIEHRAWHDPLLEETVRTSPAIGNTASSRYRSSYGEANGKTWLRYSYIRRSYDVKRYWPQRSARKKRKRSGCHISASHPVSI
jgi:hypothetical protein